MMLRQEGALDRSIDRKVRILLRLRKELTNLPIAPPAGHDDEPWMENVDEAPDSDIVSDGSQRVEAVGNLKTTDRRGNVIENKGSRLEDRGKSGNVVENERSYAREAGISLKRKGFIGNAELHATSKRPSIPPMSDDSHGHM
jgi:hypothetical protein